MRLKFFIAGVGGLLIAAGIGLVTTWKLAYVNCEQTCAPPPAFWIAGIICAVVGLIVMIGALIVDDTK